MCCFPACCCAHLSLIAILKCHPQTLRGEYYTAGGIVLQGSPLPHPPAAAPLFRDIQEEFLGILYHDFRNVCHEIVDITGAYTAPDLTTFFLQRPQATQDIHRALQLLEPDEESIFGEQQAVAQAMSEFEAVAGTRGAAAATSGAVAAANLVRFIKCITKGEMEHGVLVVAVDPRPPQECIDIDCHEVRRGKVGMHHGVLVLPLLLTLCPISMVIL